MSGEKNNQNKKKEECSLCKVSDETLKKLEEKEGFPKESEKEVKKEISWKIKVLITIFVGILVATAFWRFSPDFRELLSEMTFIFLGLGEKNQAKVLEKLPKGLKVGDSVPDFIYEDIYGNKTSLSDFQDKKPVLLVFWATWCGYCAQELPDLKTFTQKHQNEIQVIVIASGESRETVEDYIEKEEINFLMLLDEDRRIWNQYFIRGTPEHFLIGEDGKIASLRPGLAFLNDLEMMLSMLK